MLLGTECGTRNAQSIVEQIYFYEYTLKFVMVYYSILLCGSYAHYFCPILHLIDSDIQTKIKLPDIRNTWTRIANLLYGHLCMCFYRYVSCAGAKSEIYR